MEIQVSYIGPMVSNGLPRRDKIALNDDSSLSDLLDRIDALHDGAFSSLARDSEGMMLRHAKILVNGKDAEFSRSREIRLESEDEVTIIVILPVAGG